MGNLIGDRFRKIRKDHGLTQEAFGAEIGKSRDAVANIETGRVMPDETTLRYICSAYGYNEEWLKTGIGKPCIDISQEKQINSLLSDVMNVTGDSSPEDKLKRKIIDIMANLSPEAWKKLTEVAQEIKENETKKEQGE